MRSSMLSFENRDLHMACQRSGMGEGMMRGAASVSSGSESSANLSATHWGPCGRSSVTMRKTMGRSRTAST